MKKLVLFVLLVIATSLVCDELTLKDGRILTGNVIGKKSEFLYFKTYDKYYQVSQDQIQKLSSGGAEITKTIFTRKDFMDETPIDTIVIGQLVLPVIQIKEDRKQYQNPNMKLLPLSFVCFGIAWDFLKEADDYSELGGDFKKDATRKYIVGSTAILAGLINTVISFERVEIKGDNNSLTLSYKF